MSKVQLSQTEWMHKLLSWFEFLTLEFTWKVGKFSLVILATKASFEHLTIFDVAGLASNKYWVKIFYLFGIYSLDLQYKWQIHNVCFLVIFTTIAFLGVIKITCNIIAYFLSLGNNCWRIFSLRSDEKNSFFKIQIRKNLYLRFSV